MTQKTEILSLYPEELRDLLQERGIAGYRAGQIYAWFYRGIRSFEEMTDLPRDLRSRLDADFTIESFREEACVASRLDETRKYLFTLSDGEYVESVLLSYKHGYSVCLSTQAGCRMGCRFCASTGAGFSRNLRPSEILEQIAAITRERRREDPSFRVSHVVLMGIGEPLDNYENVLRFLKLVNRKEGFGISFRNISLSTCGLVPRIRDLAKEELPVTLSVSLHAPNDALRDSMMPVNKRYPLEELIPACRDYTRKTGRRISFEYALIHGVNDTDRCAGELIALLSGWMNHVNLIPVNETDETAYHAGTRKELLAFQSKLERGGLNATIRRTLGADIAAACGQLRRKKGTEKG